MAFLPDRPNDPAHQEAADQHHGGDHSEPALGPDPGQPGPGHAPRGGHPGPSAGGRLEQRQQHPGAARSAGGGQAAGGPDIGRGHGPEQGAAQQGLASFSGEDDL